MNADYTALVKSLDAQAQFFLQFTMRDDVSPDGKAKWQEFVDNSNRAAGALDSLQAQVEVLREESRKQRDALFQFSYPPDAKTLREIADEIDCGHDCEHGHTEWDTNAHSCSRERRDEGCAAMKAWELRQFADAIETRAALTQSSDAEMGEKT